MCRTVHDTAAGAARGPVAGHSATWTAPGTALQGVDAPGADRFEVAAVPGFVGTAAVAARPPAALTLVLAVAGAGAGGWRALHIWL